MQIQSACMLKVSVMAEAQSSFNFSLLLLLMPSCCFCLSFVDRLSPRQLPVTEHFILHPETRAWLLLHTLLSVMVMWDLKVWPLMSFWSGFCVRM